MNIDEFKKSVIKGKSLINKIISKETNIIGFGEMGIGIHHPRQL